MNTEARPRYKERLDDSKLILSGPTEGTMRKAQYRLSIPDELLAVPNPLPSQDNTTLVSIFNITCAPRPFLLFSRSSSAGNFKKYGQNEEVPGAFEYTTRLPKGKETMDSNYSFLLGGIPQYDPKENVKGGPHLQDFCTDDGKVIVPSRETLMNWHRKLGQEIENNVNGSNVR